MDIPLPKQGWVYRYEPATRFVGAYHDEGGKKSICHFEDQSLGDYLGPLIALTLNAHCDGFAVTMHDVMTFRPFVD